MNNKKSKIGCFFGTFNPIHNGHMMMANYVLEHTDICRVKNCKFLKFYAS